jgi:hypothetical protein
MLHSPVKPIPVREGKEVSAGGRRLVNEDLGHRHAEVRREPGGDVKVWETLPHV